MEKKEPTLLNHLLAKANQELVASGPIDLEWSDKGEFDPNFSKSNHEGSLNFAKLICVSSFCAEHHLAGHYLGQQVLS